MVGLLGIAQKFEKGGLAMPVPAPIRALRKITRDWGAMGPEERANPEPWQAFIARINPGKPAELTRKDLRRLATEIWDHPDLEWSVAGLVQQCATLSKRTLDRRLARAYWNRFKQGSVMFSYLGQYCASRGSRLGSPWAELLIQIPVWDCDKGPAALGHQLLRLEDRTKLLQSGSLRSQDLQGGFVDAAFGALLVNQAGKSSNHRPIAVAQSDGAELIALGKSLGDSTLKAQAGLLAYVLLKPWASVDPQDAYRDQVMSFLLQNVGDPRASQNDWDTLAGKLFRQHGINDAPAVFRVFSHWITEKTVRLFFDLIAKTTDRPDQWKERRAFWESYLDNKFVERAWFALGLEARGLAQLAKTTHGLLFGKVGGAGAASSQSVLLMQIGDLVVAEWSDNGRARFWRSDSLLGPRFNQKYYEGQTLRSMSGGVGFEAIAHQGKWYRKFADHIQTTTRVPYKGPRPAKLWGW